MSPRISYDLLGFDEQDFADADRLVRATLISQGRVPSQNRLVTITQDWGKLKRQDREYAKANNGTDAICFVGSRPETFDVWVNPNLNPDTAYFRETLVHELCHGYVGIAYGHRPRWRNFFARTLSHYDTLVSPVDMNSARRIEENFEFYTKPSKSESDEALGMRLFADQQSVMRDIVSEMHRVYDLFDRMTKKETR